MGRVYSLCAIHAYADNHRAESLHLAQLAAPNLPARQAVVLLLRCLLGQGAVGWLKKLRG